MGLGEGKERNGEGKQCDVCAVNSKLGGSTLFHIPKHLPGRAFTRFQVSYFYIYYSLLSKVNGIDC